MAVPFRIGVMQLTMEPVEETIEHVRAMDRYGFDTIWLAEAYPWWRKHQMEGLQASTALSALIARETERLTVGWGNHLTVYSSSDSGRDGSAGYPGTRSRSLPPRYWRQPHLHESDPSRRRQAAECGSGLAPHRPRRLGGRRLHLPAGPSSVRMSRRYRRRPKRREAGCRSTLAARDHGCSSTLVRRQSGLLTASIATPAFVKYAHSNMAAGAEKTGRDVSKLDLGCTVVASIHASDRDMGREGAREIAGMYLANKVQNIQASADVLLQFAGLSREEIAPVADAMERGGRLAAARAVTDDVLDRCKPIAGTPEDCVAAIEEYRAAGCTHVILELWGDQRDEQLRLFAEHVLPRFRDQ